MKRFLVICAMLAVAACAQQPPPPPVAANPPPPPPAPPPPPTTFTVYFNDNSSRLDPGGRAESLSGGQQQRVAICRALLQEPEIVLADEPVASLDPENTRIVMEALRRINRHFGATVVCNLHSVELAQAYCDRLVGMAAGRVVFDGVPSTLTDSAARELYGMDANRAPNDAEHGFAGIAARVVPAT